MYIQLNAKNNTTLYYAENNSTCCYNINNRSSIIVKKLKYIIYYTYYIIFVSKHHEKASQNICHQELCPDQTTLFTKAQQLTRGQWAISKSQKLTTVQDWKQVLYSK
jgi:hypothetical protein